MNKKEYLKKCATITDVLNKIMNGNPVSMAERMNACGNAIEIFCGDNANSQKNKRKID
jgi:hypothetical protein